MYSRYMRDVSSEVSDVKNTFSGWDQCMSKAYCNNGHHRNQGYTQPPPPVSQFPQYTQYQPAAAPVYRSQQPQYARFDAPSSNKPFNEDALPAMPSWSQSRTLRQQDTDMEMGSISNQAAQPMLPKSPHANVQEYPYQANAGAYGGDLGTSHSPYAPQTEQYGYGQGHYSPRVASPAGTAAPSYHTTAPAAPAGVARKPVSGSWRDL
ncbi:unnamed protein product [Aureobasidium mustum]|uniref:Uncharacterized protein n=1 Tax=Aureobasidium mustum TaxID=2773714 RepID=A0A9N8K2M9_9PEZI|nr:unnamed protein product [Aureobasidium mustum]